MRLRSYWLLVVASLCVLPAALADEKRIIVLGAIHPDANVVHERLQLMADYVADKLEPQGIDDVLIVVAKDRRHLLDLLRYDRVDWITETAYNAIALEQSNLAEIIARTWRNGLPTYRTMLFVRNDSPIESLSDLLDTTVAFQHSLSTSAFFVPAMELMGEALPLCAMTDPRDTRPPGCVGFTFTADMFNTAAWVHKDIVQVGAYSNIDWQTPNNLPAGFKRDFRVLHESTAIPRGLELVRATLDPALKVALGDVLLSMHDDPQADKALQSYFATRKFDQLPASDLTTIERFKAALPEFQKLNY